MPGYRADSLIRTMILGRCRRQRMGLAVCSAKFFSEIIASILAKVRNAEKDPQHVARGPILAVLPGEGSGGSELDLSAGRDRLLSGTGHHLTVARYPRGDSVQRDHDTLQVEADAGADGCGPQGDQTDHLRRNYFECSEPAVDDVQGYEHGQDDEYRLTRAWRRRRVDVAHSG